MTLIQASGGYEEKVSKVFWVAKNQNTSSHQHGWNRMATKKKTLNPAKNGCIPAKLTAKVAHLPGEK